MFARLLAQFLSIITPLKKSAYKNNSVVVIVSIKKEEFGEDGTTTTL